jgi:hypothetical protein
MPIEIWICIIAGCAVAIFATTDNKWISFRKQKDKDKE